MSSFLFTVFTPAYNRAHTIGRVFESLKAQTFRDFEWLIVDDGSDDGTGDLVGSWISDAGFPIRYIRKANGGKHTALNTGIDKARGELFLTLDSDDACVPEALERFAFHWNEIEPGERENYSAVTALCMRPDGTLEGKEFPASPFISNTFEVHNRYHISGEKWGFQRTDVLRRCRFPEFPGERFLPEGVVWNRIARAGYLTRYINERLRIYYPEQDGLTASVLKIRMNSPLGTSLYYNELSNCPIAFMDRIKAVINYIRFSLHGRIPSSSIIKNARRKLVAMLLFPAGSLFYRKDRQNVK